MIKKIFKDYSLNLEHIRAVLVTHDHADHIKAVGYLAEKCNIPVYATPEIHKGINRSYCVTEKLTSAHIRHIYKEKEIQIEDFRIVCFEVPHDGTDNVGYSICIDGKNFTFLTDIGHITETAAKYINEANYLVMEANYDESMLQMGPYPRHLKERIAGPNGHMCTHEMAEFLAGNFPSGLKCLWLCHLSKDNNHPELAYKTVELAFREKGIVVGKDVEVVPLKRTVPSGIYVFE